MPTFLQRNAVYLLVGFVACLIALGLVALLSTGAFARDSHGDPDYFLKRQALWLGVGIVVCIVASLIDVSFWRASWWFWFGLAILLLIGCFVPSFGMEINGSKRWINLRVINFQPSELAKIASVMFLAFWFTKFEANASQVLKGFFLPAMVVGVPMGLIMAEVDIGSTLLIGGTMAVLMFISGTRTGILVLLVLLGLAGIAGAVILIPERMDRFTAFLDLEKFREGEGLQQYQALIAFGSGGLEGLGLGLGRQKMLYVPYAHTDFIFPMIGEELGLRFTLPVVFAYLTIFVSASCICIHARNRFGMLFGFGLSFLVAFQAAVNIGVTTALLPNKGLPLPFVSYGGSNLVICLFVVGVLISLHRTAAALPQAANSNKQLQVGIRRRTPRI